MHILTAILSLFVIEIKALGWAARQDGYGDDRAYALSTDNLGNVYVAGYYLSAPLAVYDSNGINVKSLPTSSSYGAYVVKYASDGSFLWAAY